MDKDEEMTAIINGLSRVMMKLMEELVRQKALDREATISTFRAFAKSESEREDRDAGNEWGRYWADCVVKALEGDPGRPPPAQVIPLFPHHRP